MADYPYAMGTGKIPLLFQTIGEKGVPPKVTNKWLEQFGMGSSNDRRLIPVLKFVGFIDNNGTPTERWKEYRGAKSRLVLAEAIKYGYADLFASHPNAHAISTNELATYIRTNSDLGSQAVSKTVGTFRALVGLADFGGTKRDDIPNPPKDEENGDEGTPPPPPPSREASQSPVVINVNLQLSLPESDNPAVFDAIFGSLKRNVLSSGTE